MGRPDMAAVDRRLRMASSSPDVKALFNAPSYIYDLEEQEDAQTSYLAGPQLDYWTPLAPIVRIVPLLYMLCVLITVVTGFQSYEAR